MSLITLGSATVGTMLLARSHCLLSRLLGACLLGTVLVMLASPAWADQTVMAADGSQVDCTASARDLTRISLVDDAFASVSKISGGNPTDDFSVANEPLRGDIYLSVPEGFPRGALSFFATSKRGYVYKFVCRIAGDAALQVFISNPAIASADAAPPAPRAANRQDAALALVQAMYGNLIIQGYEMRQRALRPVAVGALSVQLIAEYRGPELVGKVLRIENRGKAEVQLTEAQVAPGTAVAVSILEPRLAPGRVTTAYLIAGPEAR